MPNEIQATVLCELLALLQALGLVLHHFRGGKDVLPKQLLNLLELVKRRALMAQHHLLLFILNFVLRLRIPHDFGEESLCDIDELDPLGVLAKLKHVYLIENDVVLLGVLDFFFIFDNCLLKKVDVLLS